MESSKWLVPQQFRLDEFVRQGLLAHNAPRTNVADPGAGCFGVEVDERTLVPGKDARLGAMRFEAWLTQSAKPTSANPQSTVNAVARPAKTEAESG
jgi:hypothetical protein